MYAGNVDRLVVLERTARNDPAANGAVCELFGHQLYQTVIQQYVRSFRQLVRQLGVCDGHMIRITLTVAHAKGERAAFLELGTAAQKAFDADLRPFGIQQYRHRTVVFLAQPFDAVDSLLV
ncbi:hypothetical protein SDC9_180900 [bioreactor metagenome]|uniref:Uncharacterized protein n=1 Tax=bioreactor metagenome TaxID=1076179 RepID=A0A645HC92_9ZZZZ